MSFYFFFVLGFNLYLEFLFYMSLYFYFSGKGNRQDNKQGKEGEVFIFFISFILVLFRLSRFCIHVLVPHGVYFNLHYLLFILVFLSSFSFYSLCIIFFSFNGIFSLFFIQWEVVVRRRLLYYLLFFSFIIL